MKKLYTAYEDVAVTAACLGYSVVQISEDKWLLYNQIVTEFSAMWFLVQLLECAITEQYAWHDDILDCYVEYVKDNLLQGNVKAPMSILDWFIKKDFDDVRDCFEVWLEE